jgi:hypothetical protein
MSRERSAGASCPASFTAWSVISVSNTNPVPSAWAAQVADRASAATRRGRSGFPCAGDARGGRGAGDARSAAAGTEHLARARHPATPSARARRVRCRPAGRATPSPGRPRRGRRCQPEAVLSVFVPMRIGRSRSARATSGDVGASRRRRRGRIRVRLEAVTTRRRPARAPAGGRRGAANASRVGRDAESARDRVGRAARLLRRGRLQRPGLG